jgi:hypothetical protein
MELDWKCCFVVFQQGVNLVWQLFYNVSLFKIICWQIGGSRTRFLVSNINFVSNGDVFWTQIIIFSYYLIIYNMSLAIIDILSMIIKFEFISCSITLLGSMRMNEYSHVEI